MIKALSAGDLSPRKSLKQILIHPGAYYALLSDRGIRFFCIEDTNRTYPPLPPPYADTPWFQKLYAFAHKVHLKTHQMLKP